MPLLTNVLVSTARGAYNSGTGATAAETTYLTGVPAHIGPVRATSIMLFGQAILGSDYEMDVASGTDIAQGDKLATITLLDGVTAWPGDSSGSNVWYRVKHAAELGPVLLPTRKVFVERVRIGGPAHA